MSSFRIKQKTNLMKRPKFVRVTRDKIEFYYANMFFLYTIAFLLICGFFNFAGRTDDYLARIMISQIEYTIPLLAYLYVARNNIDFENGVRDLWKSLSSRLNFHRISFLKILISAVIGVAIIPFLSFINIASSFWVKDVTTDRAVEASAKHPLWLMLVFVCIIPPIVEELTYRGVYFTAYRRAGIIKGALISAAIFALMHGNLNQCAYAVVAGFLFAMISYAGGSVLCTIIIHVIINASSVITMYSDRTGFYLPGFIVNRTEFKNIGELFRGMGLYAIVGLVIVLAGYYALRALKERENLKAGLINAPEKPADAAVLDAPLVIALLIMIANMIANEFIK